MAIHIRYEFDALNDAAMRWRIADQNHHEVEANLFLEAFLLHARNLIEFLFNVRRPWEDDVVAADFLPAWKPPFDAVAGEQVIGSDEELGLYARMSKRLAHISTARLEPNTGRWVVLPIATSLLHAFDAFLKALGDKAEWFSKPYTTRG